jgi:hypothetical protein
MKKVILIILGVVNLFGWEINTHRAIDRQASMYSDNFKVFLSNSDLKEATYWNEKFEGYYKQYNREYTYFSYVEFGETNGISNKYWKQIFNNHNAQDLIEAGSILEDAQWPHWLDGGEHNYYDIADGRFNNHFYDPQKGGKGLSFGTDAITWATGEETKGEMRWRA